MDRIVNLAAVPGVHEDSPLLSEVKHVVGLDLSRRVVDGAPAYSVRGILDVCQRGRGCQNLVDWKGHGLD